MSLEIEMRPVFHVKKTLRFTVSNKLYHFKSGIKLNLKYQISMYKITNIKMRPQ